MKLAPFQDQKVLSYPLSKTISANAFPLFKTVGEKTTPFCKTITRRCLPSKMVSHIPVSTLDQGTLKTPHCRNDRQHTLTLSSYRDCCQNANIEANTPRRPNKTTRRHSEINRCLSQETTTTNTSPQQVSHFTTVNQKSSMGTNLITGTAIDGHTSFHTTIQVITSQGCKPLHVKVNPGASCSSIPLSHFHEAFPKFFTKSETLQKTAIKATWMTWPAHDGTCQNFLGYIVLDIQHKTLPQVLPCKFYVFEDFTSPDILLSYPTSSRLGVEEFTVPNKVPINFPAMIDTITSSKTVTFSPHIEDIPQKPHNSSNCKAKPIIKQHFQDHPSPVTPSQDHLLAPC